MKTPKGEINDKIFELVKDEALLAKMAEAKSPQACYDLVKDKIPGVSFEEFTASMTVAYSYAQEAEAGLLNEEELDQVAGGKSTNDQVSMAITGITTVASIVGACASAAAA